MLDYKTQSQLVDATAAILRTYLTATTNTVAASTWHGLSLWAELMGVGSPRRAPVAATAPALWPSMANWMTAPQFYAWPAWPWQVPGNAAGMGLAPFARTWLGPSFSLWAPMPDWGMWGRTSLPVWSGWLDPRTALAAVKAPPAVKRPAPKAAPYASYRSAGGHAAAQVIVADVMPVAEIAEVTATVVLSPMHTMLGVWRAALGR